MIMGKSLNGMKKPYGIKGKPWMKWESIKWMRKTLRIKERDQV